MYKQFTRTINELTERGLSSEASQLYNVFIKVAALTENRIVSTLALSDPERNSEEKERAVAAERIAGWLRGSENEFTSNELAGYIIQENYYTFAGKNALGSALTIDEVSEVKDIIMQRLDSNPQGGDREEPSSEDGVKTYTEESEVGYIVDTILKGSGETGRPSEYFVRMSRSSGEYSDAHISSKMGSIVSFVVPVNNERLGFKVYSLAELSLMGMTYDPSSRKVTFG